MPTTDTYREGNKGNGSFQLKVLKGLQKIADNSGNNSALTTAIAALTSAVSDHQEFEIKLVRDPNNGNEVYQQRNEYDETSDSWSISYVDVTGATVVPTVIADLEYLDPDAVLNLILTELQTLTGIDFATETTLASILADTTSLDGKDFATEVTQQAIDTKLTGVARTPNFIRPTTASNIAVLTYDVSVSNVGTTDGTVLGGLIKPGDTLNFDAGALNNFYAAGTFTYDATGTEFLIIYNS